MKRVLYLAYFFPPLGGAGVQRTLKFVHHLPSFGWRPTVLASASSYWMEDESLSREIPPEAEVTRVRAWGMRIVQRGVRADAATAARSSSSVARARALSRWLLVPDAYWNWVLPAHGAAERILARRPHDAMISTSSPDSAHLLALWIKRRRRIPWIADLRDPWTQRLSYSPPTPLHDALHRALERRVLLGADHVVVTSDETRDDYLRRTPMLDPARISVVTNGFDEEDFARAAELAARAPDLTAETRGAILHAGQLNPERPIAPYLQGLRIVAARRPQDAPHTVFLGGHYDADAAVVRELGLQDRVRFLPPKPHTESVAALLDARILLLLENDSPRGKLILPGKIFEYLRSGRPILALVPEDGAAARMIREQGAGRVADPSSPESIARALEELLARTANLPFSKDYRELFFTGVSGAPPDAPAPAIQKSVNSFERRELTARLAEILDTIVASESPS